MSTTTKSKPKRKPARPTPPADPADPYKVGTSITVDLTIPEYAEPQAWFAGSSHIELRAMVLTLAELIEMAARASNTSPAGLAADALANKARLIITAKHASRSTNSKIVGPNIGAADDRLAQACKDLKAAGQPVTPSRLQSAAKTNFLTAQKWLRRNPQSS